MKKILTLFAVVGLFAFSSCSDDDNEDQIDYDTISYVFDVNNVSFSRTSNSENIIDFDSRILSGDVVLVYRYSGVTSSNAKIWTPVPNSYYYDNGNLYFSYKFDFTQNDVRLFIEGIDLDINPIPTALSNNQTFRIVIVPGDDGFNTNKSVNKPDYSDYYKVIKKYNIDDSKVKSLN